MHLDVYVVHVSCCMTGVMLHVAQNLIKSCYLKANNVKKNPPPAGRLKPARLFVKSLFALLLAGPDRGPTPLFQHVHSTLLTGLATLDDHDD